MMIGDSSGRLHLMVSMVTVAPRWVESVFCYFSSLREAVSPLRETFPPTLTKKYRRRIQSMIIAESKRICCCVSEGKVSALCWYDWRVGFEHRWYIKGRFIMQECIFYVCVGNQQQGLNEGSLPTLFLAVKNISDVTCKTLGTVFYPFEMVHKP